MVVANGITGTVRLNGLEVMLLKTKLFTPSVRVMLHGAVPVSITVRWAESPTQIGGGGWIMAVGRS